VKPKQQGLPPLCLAATERRAPKGDDADQGSGPVRSAIAVRNHANRNHHLRATFCLRQSRMPELRCASFLLCVSCALWRRSIPAIGSCPTRICLKRPTRRRSPAYRSIGMRTARRRSHRGGRFKRRGSDQGKLVRRRPPCIREPIRRAGGTRERRPAFDSRRPGVEHGSPSSDGKAATCTPAKRYSGWGARAPGDTGGPRMNCRVLTDRIAGGLRTD
jgi:hypothetical protein